MGRLSKIDPSSYSQPEFLTTKRTIIEWRIDFPNTKISGRVTHHFQVFEINLRFILLDVRDINVYKVEIISDDGAVPLKHSITDAVDDIGEKLTLELPLNYDNKNGNIEVRIDYETSSIASGLKWLTPIQTLGKKHPFLFSQCEPIHARSIMPCQDTPAVKFTYEAYIHHPKELTVLMSALTIKREPGFCSFHQKVPIPSYLLAIAVGKLSYKTLNKASKVWAEESILDACAEEFLQTPEMLKIATDICGPYEWYQYDLLVMPPSFPFGGMENPCLTFVTPTLLAGDKSLACVIAHEIAHSWTGNLVTNKNFEHFWLNEGFTVFLETKIIGRMQGSVECDYHMLRNLTELQECIRTQLTNTPELTRLVVNLSNCSPDDAFSIVPYVKGSTFLRYLEDLLGGPEIFETFLRFYFQKYAFQSIITDDFKNTLFEYFNGTPQENKLVQVDWNLWLFGEGMPPIIPKFNETLSKVSKNLAMLWSCKTSKELVYCTELKQKLTTHQLIDFLGKLIEYKDICDMTITKMELLESTYDLKLMKNAEVQFRLMRLYIKARLIHQLDTIIAFVNSNFRMKFCRPLYRDLALWLEVKPKVIENFMSVKEQMMSVCSHAIMKDLGLI